MFVDIARYGKGLYEIPIKAICVCPELLVYPPSFEIQLAFINHEYKYVLHVNNPTDFPARLEYIEQKESSMSEALIETSKIYILSLEMK